MNFLAKRDSGVNLQATLASSSAESIYVQKPHHPISCLEDLRYNDDGSFECPHTKVGPDDPRTQECLRATTAILIIELARAL